MYENWKLYIIWYVQALEKSIHKFSLSSPKAMLFIDWLHDTILERLEFTQIELIK